MLTFPFTPAAPVSPRLPRLPWARRLGLPVEIKAPSRRPSESRPNQMFLHVRSVGADGFAHLFQFAIVNADGDVVVSVFARARSPIRAGGTSCPGLPSVWWDQLEDALKQEGLPEGLADDLARQTVPELAKIIAAKLAEQVKVSYKIGF